jgi:hypothetical protein
MPHSEKPINKMTLAMTSWLDLFQANSKILETYYRNVARALGSTVGDSLALSELRVRVSDAGLDVPKTEKTLAEFEKRVVLASRLTSAWMVAWTSILPLSATLLYGVYRLRNQDAWGPSSMVVTLFVSLAVFLAAQIAGLVVQGLVARPASRFINRLVGLK